MAFRNKAFLTTSLPILIGKRYRGKINVQKPRKPHFEKQLLIDLSKPYYYPIAKNARPEITLCDKGKNSWKKEEIDNPFERILAKECLGWFNKSKMVVFLHTNPISMERKLPIYASLKKNNMNLRTYGKKIVNMATKGTQFEVVNDLFVSHQNLLFGQPEKAVNMFKILKKAPEFVVMGGIIEDKLLSKNELVEYSQLPKLDVARSQFCSILQSASSLIVRQLSQNQQALVGYLEQHVDIQNSPKSETVPADDLKQDGGGGDEEKV